MQHTYNGSFTLSYSVVEAGIGVDIESSYEISRSYTRDLDSGEIGLVKIWAYYDKYIYDIYKDHEYYKEGNIYV